jgi:hypothetical protein
VSWIGGAGLTRGGAVAAAFNDLYYDPTGYMWMGLNVLIGSGYTLMVNKIKSTHKELRDMDLVWLNATMSFPMITVPPSAPILCPCLRVL